MEYIILTRKNKGWESKGKVLILFEKVKYFETHSCEDGNSRVVFDDDTSFIIEETIAEIEQLILDHCI